MSKTLYEANLKTFPEAFRLIDRNYVIIKIDIERLNICLLSFILLISP